MKFHGEATAQKRLHSQHAASAMTNVNTPHAQFAKANNAINMIDRLTRAVKMRVFSTNEFAADSGDTDKAFEHYLHALQAERIPMIGNLADLQGICHWEAKQGVAAGLTANYAIHFAKLGYSLWTDVKMPDPFVP